MLEKAKATQREIHLRDYLVELDRYKRSIIAVFVVALASTILYLAKQGTVYQAQATVIIEPKQVQQVVLPQSAQAITQDQETQMEIIKTTPVLASVAKQVNLTTAHEGTLEFSRVVKQLRKGIRIGFLRNTKMVTIGAKHVNPQRARDIADAIAQAYIDQDRYSRQQSQQKAVRRLSTQLADLRIQLRNSEEAFQRFRESEEMITLDDRREEELELMSKLNASYVAARANRLEIEAVIDRLASEGSVDRSVPLALLNSSIFHRLATQLTQLKTELADEKKLFKDTYPGVIELSSRVQLTERRILEELKGQRDFLKAQEDSFLSRQEAKRKETLGLSGKEREYMTLEREAMANREMYNALLTKVKEASLVGEADLGNIRIVEPAELPTDPIGNKRLTLALGGTLGLFLGVGSAFFLKYLENAIRTPDDVAEHLGLPVLGVVPQVAKAKGARLPPIIAGEDPEAAQAEAYRNVLASVLFSGAADPPKTILVTSAGPKEGKSLTVVNMAVALAQMGKNVLVVDANLRGPILHSVFNLDRDNGLSTVLSKEMTTNEAIVKSIPGQGEAIGLANLSVLTSGKQVAGPSELIGTPGMKELIRHVQEQYDVVLLDSAHVLGISDTVLLAAEVDGVMLVVKTGETTRKALRMTMERLERVGAKMCGVLLNNVDFRRDRYFCYYHYGYYFGDIDLRSLGKEQKRRGWRNSRKM